jgi:DNA-directed RNA polymerase subunit H
MLTKMAEKFDVTKHILVAKHSKLGEKERKELFQKFAADLRNLPRILSTDPAIEGLDVKEGDVIKILRKSETAGETVYYRRVVK